MSDGIQTIFVAPSTFLRSGRSLVVTQMGTQSASILLYGIDAGLVKTRAWVLEREGFSMLTALRLADLQKIGAEEPISLFLLCDSLDQEARTRALALIHSSWPRAKRLVLAPVSLPVEIEPTEEVFTAMEGPHKLVKAIRTLIADVPYSPMSGARHNQVSS